MIGLPPSKFGAHVTEIDPSPATGASSVGASGAVGGTGSAVGVTGPVVAGLLLPNSLRATISKEYSSTLVRPLMMHDFPR